MLAEIIIANIIISSISLVGVLTLSFKDKFLKNILMLLVSFSAGALLGGAFFHLVPEALEMIGVTDVMIFILLGFGMFFIIEKVLHWRHCHDSNCKVHTFGYVNLIGDSVHNFIDGLVIAASFITDISLGFATTIAVALHEIPQEIGDFGVLLHSGFTKKKALMFNFLTAFTAILGGIIGFYLSNIVSGLTAFLLPFAAGGFIYISASDLLPEIRKEPEMSRWIVNLLIFISGIALMFFFSFLE